MVSARQTSEFIFFNKRIFIIHIQKTRNQNFSHYHYTIMDKRIDCLGHQMFRVHGAKR